MEIDLRLYTAAELLAFYSKFENPVILGRARFCVNPCDVVLTEILSKQLLKYHLSLFIYTVLLLCLSPQSLKEQYFPVFSNIERDCID